MMTSLRERLDGWINLLTGLGVPNAERRTSYFSPDAWIQPEELAALYHQDSLAATIVEALPAHALRGGVILLGQGATNIRNDLKSLGILSRLKEGFSWGRALGGAVGVLGTLDSSNGQVDVPLDPSTVKAVKFLDIYDRRDVQRMPGQPDYYRVRELTSYGSRDFAVHKSRTILFKGVLTGDQERQALDGWDASVLQRVYDPLKAFNEGSRSVDHLLTEASTSVYTLRGLLGLLASPGGRDLLNVRSDVMNRSRSVFRAVYLDKESEETYSKVATQFTGLGEVLDRLAKRVSSAARMPMTVLFGQSPAGMNATGESDTRGWYDEVASYQTDEVLPALEVIVRLCAIARGVEPPKISFPSLWQESPSEKAERQLKVAQRDKIYFEMAVLESADIRAARFRPEGYSDETPFKEPTPYTLPGGGDAPAGKTVEIPLTPSAIGAITTVNEARASILLPPLDGPDGKLTIASYQAKFAGTIATASAAEAGEAKDINAAPSPPAPPQPPPSDETGTPSGGAGPSPV